MGHAPQNILKSRGLEMLFYAFSVAFLLRKSLLGQHQDKAVALSCLMLATGLMKTPSRSGKCM